ncbi:cation-translocating P-type ATPase [Synechococcus sp. CS-1331]|uniref:heavy metal translocating P-type ATPase n=1 Tax=Synechococcus sp. CS-1331 TaxID=2847973 RepID=UPI00223AC29C|nr:cation-translocating P-type ATPase [Synechococcus sp. CS-1331]
MSSLQEPPLLEPLLFEIEGMKCGGCVRAVEQRLLGQPGVRQASVNLLTRTAWVDVVSAEASQAALLHSLAGLGFQARLRPSDAELPSRRQRLQSQNWWQHWRQLVVALGLLLVSVLGHLSLAGLGALWIHALVATVTLAVPGRPILVRGVRAALAGLPSMDTLVGLGVISAYLASLVGFLWPQTGWPCFFNEPVMLLGFVLLGRFLEERARFRTGRALEELAELQPDTALLLLGEGPPRPVRVGGLRPGDRVQLLPGDRVPVDGVVRQGSGAVDVSGLTGEPLPVAAIAGTELSAGSLNLDAPLVLEVLRRGADSAIARIIHLVERAQARKAPIQGLADRLAGRFTLVVLALALATLLFWWLLGTQLWPQVLQPAPLAGAHGAHAGHPMLAVTAETPFALALQLSIAVLVVACPCALGLATPTAITVAMGRAARGGLLFRGGDAIETAAGLRAMLFDKTGTLTRGRPLVTAVEPLQAASSDRLVQLAASLEAGSRHPLGFALLQEAQRRGLELLPVAEAHSWAGQGVSGRIEGQSLRVGRLAWLEASPSPELLARQALLECQGASVLAVGGEQGVLGLVAAADQPRPDAAGVLTALRAMGLQLGLLSGDRREPVQQLGASLGLAEAELGWELRPEQKLERILQHPAHGALAMVGDGINDAPALAAADLGIAVGTGTQIAQDSAGLVVMGDRLEGIVAALRLARRTMAKVRQNLAWAFGYNLIVLPLAAGVLLPGYGVLLTPPLAALLMALSSITVVVNALLLQDGLQDLR